MSEDLSKFVDAQVIDIVRRSMIYKHLLKSKDHESLTDISLGTCSINILCYLKTKYKESYSLNALYATLQNLLRSKFLFRRAFTKSPNRLVLDT